MAPIDLQYRAAFPLLKAIECSPHPLIWRATLRSGTVICEQPGLSSDHLPRDEVVRMEYVPKQKGIPVVACNINLDKGERFVRHWTTIWKPAGGGQKRVFVLGIESRQGKFALLSFDPTLGKFALGAQKPFSPGWIPEATKGLPSDCIVRGGPGTNHIGWVHDGFGGTVLARASELLFAAAYE